MSFSMLTALRHLSMLPNLKMLTVKLFETMWHPHEDSETTFGKEEEHNTQRLQHILLTSLQTSNPFYNSRWHAHNQEWPGWAGTTNTKDPTSGNLPKQTCCSYIPPPFPVGDYEFHDAMEYTVNNKKNGLAYLSHHLLNTPDWPMDLHNILTTIHQITHLPRVLLPAKEALCLVAFIIEDHVASEKSHTS